MEVQGLFPLFSCRKGKKRKKSTGKAKDTAGQSHAGKSQAERATDHEIQKERRKMEITGNVFLVRNRGWSPCETDAKGTKGEEDEKCGQQDDSC